MKLLTDYSDQELVNIQPEERQSLYLLELANQGIPLPSAVPNPIDSPETRDDLKPDVIVYEVGNFHFESENDAKAVADLISAKATGIDYDWRYSARNYFLTLEPINVVVSTKLVYSAGKYTQYKSEIEDYEKRKNEFKKQNDRRSKILDNQAAVMGQIDDRIAEAQRNVTRVNEFRDMLSEYLKMANKDRKVAVRFLLNAHYAEIADYEDEQLAGIGLSRQDIQDFDNNSMSE